PVPFSEPGLHDQSSIRIPMAFTAHSQRVRCGRVPIAFSDMTQCPISKGTGLLGRALVVINRAPALASPESPDKTKARCLHSIEPSIDPEMVLKAPSEQSFLPWPD